MSWDLPQQSFNALLENYCAITPETQGLAACLQNAGSLPFFLILLLALLFFGPLKPLLEKALQEDRLALTSFLCLLILLIAVQTLIGALLAVVSFVAWLLLREIMQRWRLKMPFGRTIRIDVLVLVLVPILYVAGRGYDWLVPTREKPPAIFLLPSQIAVGAIGDSDLEKVFTASRNNLIAALKHKLEVVPRQEVLANGFDKFRRVLNVDWSELPRQIRNYPEAIGRKLEFIRSSIYAQSGSGEYQIWADWKAYDPAKPTLEPIKVPLLTLHGPSEHADLIFLVVAYHVVNHLLTIETGKELKSIESEIWPIFSEAFVHAYFVAGSKAPKVPSEIRDALDGRRACNTHMCVAEVVAAVSKSFDVKRVTVDPKAEAEAVRQLNTALTAYKNAVGRDTE